MKTLISLFIIFALTATVSPQEEKQRLISEPFTVLKTPVDDSLCHIRDEIPQLIHSVESISRTIREIERAENLRYAEIKNLETYVKKEARARSDLNLIHRSVDSIQVAIRPRTEL